MILPPEQTTRFYHIWFPLLYYVNQKLHLVDEFPSDWEAEGSVKPATAVKLRDALWENDNLREQFIAENPARLSPTDLALVESWSSRVAGNFFIFRHLKKYSVFLSSDDPVKAYGVVGLVSPIEEIVGPYLPIYVQAVLLPFEDKIIYDSLLAPYAVTFGGGYRSSLKEAYRDAQEREGIITDLRPRPKSGNPAEIREELVSRTNKVLGLFVKTWPEVA